MPKNRNISNSGGMKKRKPQNNMLGPMQGALNGRERSRRIDAVVDAAVDQRPYKYTPPPKKKR